MTALEPGHLVSHPRRLVERLQARPASDGDGVKLLRVFGGGDLKRFDPFLMLDEFGSTSAEDYQGGFPAHPHRGFETVTYMLQGQMEHRDHLGHVGLLADGGVQWMTAGRGIIHSEMPKQTQGLMRGFQLWLNLPASQKGVDPRYCDVPPSDLPRYAVAGGRVAEIIALAGDAQVDIQGERLAIQGWTSRQAARATAPLYWDLHLSAGSRFRLPLPAAQTLLVYVYQGSLSLPDSSDDKPLSQGELGRFVGGDGLSLDAIADMRCLILAGQPLGEPIVQYGPFVMNTQAEIEQAIADYRHGRLTAASS
jgi:quercetin 2,3-dioxygenase